MTVKFITVAKNSITLMIYVSRLLKTALTPSMTCENVWLAVSGPPHREETGIGG